MQICKAPIDSVLPLPSPPPIAAIGVQVVGRSERSVSALFAAVRAAAPCVLFLDQVRL